MKEVWERWVGPRCWVLGGGCVTFHWETIGGFFSPHPTVLISITLFYIISSVNILVYIWKRKAFFKKTPAIIASSHLKILTVIP